MKQQTKEVIQSAIDALVADPDVPFSGPDMRRKTISALYYALGLRVLPNGQTVPLGKEVKMSYGQLLAGGQWEVQDAETPEED